MAKIKTIKSKKKSLSLSPTSTSLQFPVPDYEKWFKRDYWTVNESACLICGHDPEIKIFSRSTIQWTMELSANIQEVKESIIRSIEVGSLKFLRLKPYQKIDGSTRLKQEDVLKWIQRKKISLPKEMAALLEKLSLSIASKNPNQSEDVQQQKAHGNTEHNAKIWNEILGAALVAVVHYREECLDKHGKISGTGIYKVLDERAPIFFKSCIDGTPPRSADKIIREINYHLKKVKK